jgi:SAM-dependent methyltransferase
MGLLEATLRNPTWRQRLWAWWYPFFTRRIREQHIDFLNYSFASEFESRPVLQPLDEPNRPNLQLYCHVTAGAQWSNAQVLEVSSGHGGAASFFSRTYQPARYVGLDLNPEALRYCQQRHEVPGLSFIRGNALALPFPDQSFDLVLNVEASHCYPDFAKFLQEVARVLKPGGTFYYADLRPTDEVERWIKDLTEVPGLRLERMQLINAEVLAGMRLNTPRYNAMVQRAFPSFLQSLTLDFAGVEGSRLYRELAAGNLSYRSFRLTRL